jgi:hypothetical protein
LAGDTFATIVNRLIGESEDQGSSSHLERTTNAYATTEGQVLHRMSGSRHGECDPAALFATSYQTSIGPTLVDGDPKAAVKRASAAFGLAPTASLKTVWTP